MMMEAPPPIETEYINDVTTVDLSRIETGHEVVVTFDDAQRLMKIAQAEAGNQGVDGMALVMQTVLNRVEDESFPDTVYDVIAQKGQFETFSNGSYDRADPSVEAHIALAEIEMGMFYQHDTIVAFEVTGNRTLDKYFMYAFTLKGHDFYTKKQEVKKSGSNSFKQDFRPKPKRQIESLV